MDCSRSSESPGAPLLFALGILLIAAAFAPRASASDGSWTGPVVPIAGGYGSWGAHGVSAPARFGVQSHGYTNGVTIYFPGDQAAPAPVIFFATGWDIPCESYGELLRFLASKGYVAVCDDYGEDSGIIGDQLLDAFVEAADRYGTRMDTSRFGLAGHSSGAGLLPSLGYRLAVDHGWGTRGMFIFSSAPWFDFDITDAMLNNYPSDMKLIVQTYEDDTSTDLRTYIDQFESLTRIPDSEKEYITLRPSVVSGYRYRADHPTIATGGQGYGVYDAMDSYGVFRLMDALADYAFTGNEAARVVALGDGSDEQLDMGPLRDLVSTDDPRPIPGETYEYPCDVDYNPRRQHCDDFDRELPASVLIWPTRHVTVSQGSPAFIWEPVPTANRYFLQLRPLLANGDVDWSVSYGENVAAADAGCSAGARECSHTIETTLPNGDYVWWIKGYGGRPEGVWSRDGHFREFRRREPRHPDGRQRPGNTGAWTLRNASVRP